MRANRLRFRKKQAMLADLCIPQRGIFGVVTAVLEG